MAVINLHAVENNVNSYILIYPTERAIKVILHSDSRVDF